MRGKELNENQILVRGPASEVDRAVQMIHKAVADAEQYEIDHSYVTEFSIPQEYVGRIVGSQGSAIKLLKEDLDVKIDFIDEAGDNKEWSEKGRGKKAVSKSKVKIQGTKETAEQAKKRILAQIEKLVSTLCVIIFPPPMCSFRSLIVGGRNRGEVDYCPSISPWLDWIRRQIRCSHGRHARCQDLLPSR